MHVVDAWMNRWAFEVCLICMLISIGLWVRWLRNFDERIRISKEEDKRFWRWYRHIQNGGRRLYVVDRDP